MFWKRKKAVQESAPQPVKSGFFSTDFDPIDYGMSHHDRVQRALSNTFQIRHNKFIAKDSAGQVINSHGTTFAMDSELLQEAKAFNTSLGFIPVNQLEWYGQQGFIGWQLAAMLSQHWLIDKACGMPAQDAVRHGYEVTVNDGSEVSPEVMDEFRRLDIRFKVKQNCAEFIKMGRVFGIRHALFLIDGIDYELPFNPDGIRPGSYRGITQIDPYWMAPELDRSAAANPASKDFYEPTWWRVNGKRVHRTHFVIMRNDGNLPDILKPTYYYGGIPTPQKIYERVYAAERTANEAPLLAMTKRLTVLKMDLTQAMADMESFGQRMSYWTQLQNSFGVKVIGEADEIQQYDTSLADLDNTIMTQFQLVAAASQVPATKLLGTTPKGFNSTGEYDEASYHELLESIQENELSPLVNRHHLCLMRSHIGPKFGKSFNTEVVWRPVDSPTAKEQAEVNKIKADTDSVLVNAGALDAFDVRKRVSNDPDSGYNGIPEIVEGGPGDREQEMVDQFAENNAETSDKA